MPPIPHVWSWALSKPTLEKHAKPSLFPQPGTRKEVQNKNKTFNQCAGSRWQGQKEQREVSPESLLKPCGLLQKPALCRLRVKYLGRFSVPHTRYCKRKTMEAADILGSGGPVTPFSPLQIYCLPFLLLCSPEGSRKCTASIDSLVLWFLDGFNNREQSQRKERRRIRSEIYVCPCLQSLHCELAASFC